MQLIKMAKEQKYKQEECVGYLINRVSRSLNKKMSQDFCSTGSDVSAQQWVVVAKLWEKDGLNQQELSSHFGKDKTGMARMLENMETNNLIVRIPDPRDKRNKLVYLTQKAKDMQNCTVAVAEESIKKAVNDISEDDVKICKSVLCKMYKNLNEE